MKIPSKATDKDVMDMAKKIDDMMLSYGDTVVQAVMNIVSACRMRRQYNEQVDMQIQQMRAQQNPIMGSKGMPVITKKENCKNEMGRV